MTFKIAGITQNSIVDGPGMRLTIYTQGCNHHCKGCHNPETWDMNGGSYMDTDEVFDILVKDPLYDGITFSGGDPFEQSIPLAHLAKRIHNETKLNVIAFTGYTFESLVKNDTFMSLVKECDYIIDGPFDKDKKSYDLLFRGSSNQRFIDVKKSLETSRVVSLSDDEINCLYSNIL